MFNFFKRKEKSHLNGWESELFQNIFKSLGNEYSTFEKQVSEGIIETVRIDKKMPDYINFRLNIQILNKFEKKNEKMFTLNGIKILDKISREYKILNLDLGFGLILGYSVKDIHNFNPDIHKINVDSIYKVFYNNDDFDKIKSLFTNEEKDKINVSEVYEVELGGKIYYHLKDLEDGDFIGIDNNKNIFKITHDPFDIVKLNEDLENIL